MGFVMPAELLWSQPPSQPIYLLGIVILRAADPVFQKYQDRKVEIQTLECHGG